LRRCVGGAEQAGDERTEAPVLKTSDGMHRQTQGADQSHDAYIPEAHRSGSLACNLGRMASWFLAEYCRAEEC
jgi:hypothetical protein